MFKSRNKKFEKMIISRIRIKLIKIDKWRKGIELMGVRKLHAKIEEISHKKFIYYCWSKSFLK